MNHIVYCAPIFQHKNELIPQVCQFWNLRQVMLSWFVAAEVQHAIELS